MPSTDKWAPKTTGINDPRSSKKKNGMFINFCRYLYFGGVPGAPMQDGTKGPSLTPNQGNNAVGPISDRGKGR